jgi:hypothetical protein
MRKQKKSKASFELNGVVEELSQGFRSTDSQSQSHSKEKQHGASDSVSSTGLSQLAPHQATIFTFLVVTIGTIASMLFLGFGISGAVREQQIQFDLRAGEIMTEIQAAFVDYETASMWLHASCRSRRITRAEFRNMYEYMVHGGLEVEVCVLGQE